MEDLNNTPFPITTAAWRKVILPFSEKSVQDANPVTFKDIGEKWVDIWPNGRMTLRTCVQRIFKPTKLYIQSNSRRDCFVTSLILGMNATAIAPGVVAFEHFENEITSIDLSNIGVASVGQQIQLNIVSTSLYYRKCNCVIIGICTY